MDDAETPSITCESSLFFSISARNGRPPAPAETDTDFLLFVVTVGNKGGGGGAAGAEGADDAGKGGDVIFEGGG